MAHAYLVERVDDLDSYFIPERVQDKRKFQIAEAGGEVSG